MFIGHDPDPDLSDDRTTVVRAGAPHGHGPDDHQLVETLHVGSLGDRRRWGIPPVKHFVDEYPGDAAGGVLRVVVADCIDHERLKNLLKLRLHLSNKVIDLAGLDVLSDAVVGVVTLAGRDHSLPNSIRDRGRAGGPFGVPRHICLYRDEASSLADRSLRSRRCPIWPNPKRLPRRREMAYGPSDPTPRVPNAEARSSTQ